MYDQMGEAGLEGAAGGGGMGGNPADLFEHLFGFGGGRGGSRDTGPKKGKDMAHV
jgi:DnaJ family protein A protein 2